MRNAEPAPDVLAALTPRTEAGIAALTTGVDALDCLTVLALKALEIVARRAARAAQRDVA